MTIIDRVLNTISNNIGYTIVFVVAVVLFMISSNGHLIYGLVTAASAMVAYAAFMALYHSYQATPVTHTVAAKTVTRKRVTPAKKRTTKKK